MKLTFVSHADVIISIQLEIVLKKLAIANVVLNSKHQIVTHVQKDISVIQTVDHVNVILMEHSDVIVKQLMANVHVKKTLEETSVKNVHLGTMDILNVNLVIVKELVQIVILVMNQQDNVNVDLDLEDNNVTNAKMDTMTIQHVQHVVVIWLEQLKKFVIKILEAVCAKKDMEEYDVINAYLDTLVSLIVFHVIVHQLEVFKQFVMQQENVHVFKISLENVVNNV
jgi:hypothetical protein